MFLQDFGSIYWFNALLFFTFFFLWWVYLPLYEVESKMWEIENQLGTISAWDKSNSPSGTNCTLFFWEDAPLLRFQY